MTKMLLKCYSQIKNTVKYHTIYRNKIKIHHNIWCNLAQRGGFEPPKAFTLPIFETSTFNHSDISANKYTTFFEYSKLNQYNILVECAIWGPHNYWLVEGERKSGAKVLNLRTAN